MSEYKQCPQGHYYEGDLCPYCKDPGPYTAPYTCETCKAWSCEYNGGKCPYCGGRLRGQAEDIFPWWLNNAHETTIIPVCNHCGHRIRKSIPSLVGSVSTNIQDDEEQIAPWNYGWDGKCEYCGHDYTIRMGIQIDDDGNKTDKKTMVSADCMEFTVRQGSDGVVCDKYTVLSGVTIKTFVGDAAHGVVFLSANELKCLIDALKDSPLLEQHDYKFDPETN